VTINAPKYALYTEKLIVPVDVKYTFGKTVKGNLEITARETPNSPAITQTVPIDGRAIVEFDMNNFGGWKPSVKPIYLTATVIEELSGNILDAYISHYTKFIE
jgi:hypothetical protein